LTKIVCPVSSLNTRTFFGRLRIIITTIVHTSLISFRSIQTYETSSLTVVALLSFFISSKYYIFYIFLIHRKV